MGYVEIDPETGEGVLIPDPNMDGPNDQLPSLPGLDPHDGDLPGLDLPGFDLPGHGGDLPGGGGGLFDGINQLSHNLNDTVPGGGDGETPPELWLAGPQGTDEDPAADTSHHGFD
ncbi:MAG: hypothetical protein JWO79_1450 [Actinomycetia bacterium]|nr:hypothetical protein [Actinomycetes bacterium]